MTVIDRSLKLILHGVKYRILFAVFNMKTPGISECQVFKVALLVFNSSPLERFKKFPNGLTIPKDIVSLIFWSLLSTEVLTD